jgi:tRNA (cytidine32/uridine32-2'-O)-methyltransferase
MLRLKRLFNRARPEKTELNMLRGMLSTIDKLTPAKLTPDELKAEKDDD